MTCVHIGTQPQNNEICDLDPFHYREITDKHDDKFPQLRAIWVKPAKDDCAVWPL